MRVAADNAKQTLKTSLYGKCVYGLIALLVCVGSSTPAFASLSFSATKESFPKQVVGTLSAGKVVTVTSTVSQSVVITVSGDYQESDNCSGSIPTTGCAVTVKFAPTVASGTVEGAVTFTDGSGNVLGVISLTGIATGQVTATPTSESFGSVAVGATSASKTVKVINNTTFTVTNVTLTVSGDFALVPGSNCPAGLASKASCTFSVTATPTQLGTIKGAVIVTNTVNGSPNTPVVVNLTVLGTGSANSPLTLSKTSLTFKQFINTPSVSQNVVVTNSSGNTVTMNGISASPQFGETDNCPTAGNPLNAGLTCTITITATPAEVGTIQGGVAVNYSGTNSPQIISLSATGLPQVTATPASATFSTQAVGIQSTGKNIKLTNNSTSSVSITLTVSGDYILNKGTCGANLAGKASCTMTVSFLPTFAGQILGAITVTGSFANNPLIINLTGTAVNTLSASFNPTSGHQGQSLTVAITGTATHFVQGTTTANFGAGITAGTVTVSGPTSASVQISIGASVTTGVKNVTINTGGESAPGTFTVVAGVPAVTSISPNVITPTVTNLSVSVTGQFTNWVNGTTKANFGPGISVNGAAAGTFGTPSVTSPTTLTALLTTNGAALGPRDVQIQTGTQTLTVSSGMTVETCTTTPAQVLQTNPAANATNVPTNTQIVLEYNAPINGSSATATNVFVQDNSTSQKVPATVSVDASGRIVTLTLSQLLGVGRTFIVEASTPTSLKDACGNNIAFSDFFFSTGFSNSLTGPTLLGNNPLNNDTNVAVNAPVIMQFDKAIDPVTALNGGIQVTDPGTPVPGNITFSADDKTVTFNPANPFATSTVITVAVGSQVTDTAGNALTNPQTFSFTTGTAADTTAPNVTSVDPANGITGVGLNLKPHVTFSEPIDQLSLTTANFKLINLATGLIVPASVTVASDRMSATLTPTSLLLPGMNYQLQVFSYTDIAGNNGGGSFTSFTTGTSSDTTNPTVISISPPNTMTGVPVNATVVARISDDIDPVSVNNNSITVTPQGGSAIAGTVALASDGVTLTFTPASPLAVSKLYNVVVSGLKETEGNTITAFNSSFTTGSSSTPDTTPLSVSTVNPANGATLVPVNPGTVTLTFNKVVNPATVSLGTVPIRVQATGAQLAGSYAVNGTGVTFTPLTNLPGNTVIAVNVNSVADVAGNLAFFGSSFTTASTVDTTPLTVVSVTPANGTSNVGPFTQVSVTFNKSVNPSTANGGTALALFNGDSLLTSSASLSSDNRTAVFNTGQLPFGATITVEATHNIQDLSGNPLTEFHSQFTVAPQTPSASPSITSQRPANSATGVPANSVITLYANASLNASTLTNAVHVSQDGALIAGAIQVGSNGQSIEFTPGAPFTAGSLIQVFVDNTVQDVFGNSLNAYTGSFTVAGSPANVGPVAVSSNPFSNATNVALNTKVQVSYNQVLDATTVIGANAFINDNTAGGTLLATVSLVGGGQVVQIAPNAALTAGHVYLVEVTQNVHNTSGLQAQFFDFFFTAGSASDNTAGTVTGVAPTDASTNIGTNATVMAFFSKPVNPISVTGSTMQLSGGGVTEVPSSISFSTDFMTAMIASQAPFPASTQMTLAINGVTDIAGNTFTAKTTHFTTGPGPDFSSPIVTRFSPDSNLTNVPIKPVVSVQFNKPMDTNTFNLTNFKVETGGVNAAGALSFSSDATTVFFTPSGNLTANTQYCTFSNSALDLSGNVQQSLGACFTTGSSSDTTAPQVNPISPPNTFTNVPTNTLVQMMFDGPISSTSTDQVNLLVSGSPIAVTKSLINGDRGLQLTPAVPLAPNTAHTISIAGVKDLAGNTLAGTVTSSFTTGPGIDLVQPGLVSVTPANGATLVPTSTTVKAVFTKAMDAVSFDSTTTFKLTDFNGVNVPASISASADLKTFTLTPNAPLTGGGKTYTVTISNALTDLAGNNLNVFSNTTFTTQ